MNKSTKPESKIYIFVVQIVALKLKSGEPLITLYTEQNNGVKYEPKTFDHRIFILDSDLV